MCFCWSKIIKFLKVICNSVIALDRFFVIFLIARTPFPLELVNEDIGKRENRQFIRGKMSAIFNRFLGYCIFGTLLSKQHFILCTEIDWVNMNENWCMRKRTVHITLSRGYTLNCWRVSRHIAIFKPPNERPTKACHDVSIRLWRVI